MPSPMTFAAMEALERRAMFDSVGIDGVHVGYETDLGRALPLMRDLGITRVRIWNEVQDWTQLVENGSFNQARQLKALGFHVTMLIQNKLPPTYEQARAYYEFIAAAPGMRDAVDRWEILNEVNYFKYWQGTAEQYVGDVLRPAWDVLKPLGEEIVGASCTDDLRWVNLLKDAGYLNYVDFANTHPYTETVQQQVEHVLAVKQIYAGKPLVATEWNFKAPYDFSTWDDLLAAAHPQIEPHLESIYYYRLIAKTGTQAGPAGLLLSTYQPHEPFYSLFRSWNDPIAGEPPSGPVGLPTGSYTLFGPFGRIKVRAALFVLDDETGGTGGGPGGDPGGGGTVIPPGGSVGRPASASGGESRVASVPVRAANPAPRTFSTTPLSRA